MPGTTQAPLQRDAGNAHPESTHLQFPVRVRCAQPAHLLRTAQQIARIAGLARTRQKVWRRASPAPLDSSQSRARAAANCALVECTLFLRPRPAMHVAQVFFRCLAPSFVRFAPLESTPMPMLVTAPPVKEARTPRLVLQVVPVVWRGSTLKALRSRVLHVAVASTQHRDRPLAPPAHQASTRGLDHRPVHCAVRDHFLTPKLMRAFCATLGGSQKPAPLPAPGVSRASTPTQRQSIVWRALQASFLQVAAPRLAARVMRERLPPLVLAFALIVRLGTLHLTRWRMPLFARSALPVTIQKPAPKVAWNAVLATTAAQSLRRCAAHATPGLSWICRQHPQRRSVFRALLDCLATLLARQHAPLVQQDCFSKHLGLPPRQHATAALTARIQALACQNVQNVRPDSSPTQMHQLALSAHLANTKALSRGHHAYCVRSASIVTRQAKAGASAVVLVPLQPTRVKLHPNARRASLANTNLSLTQADA